MMAFFVTDKLVKLVEYQSLEEFMDIKRKVHKNFAMNPTNALIVVHATTETILFDNCKSCCTSRRLTLQSHWQKKKLLPRFVFNFIFFYV